MKLAFQKQQVIEGLQKAAGIIPSKAGAAYLRTLWLRAQDGTLSFTATDANIEFTGKYPAEVAEPGLAGVQGRAFMDLVRQLPDGTISLSTDASSANLLIEQGRRSYRLAMSSSEWFQEASGFPESGAIVWNGSQFSEYIDRVSFCISDENLQEALACLCIKPRENGRIDVCGLDGHQFAIISFIYDDMCAKIPEEGLLIQKKYLSDIKKWLAEDEIELNFNEKRVYLRRIDGGEMLSLPRALYPYPDYNIFMAKLEDPAVSSLELPCKEIIDCLGRIYVFNTDAERSVHMELTPGEASFMVQSELGSGRENIEAEYHGDLEKIAFPTKNLMEIFGHFNSGNITMKMTGKEGPASITGPDDIEYAVIIMPMQVSDSSYYDDEAR